MLKEWILSVSAAAFIGGVAAALAPEGKSRKMVSFISGFMTIAVMLAPVKQVEFTDFSAYIEQFQIESDAYTQDYSAENDKLIKEVIEEKTAAYILDKTGIIAEVRAVKTDESYPVPWEVKLYSAYEESVSLLIENDLGIPRERQNWEDK